MSREEHSLLLRFWLAVGAVAAVLALPASAAGDTFTVATGMDAGTGSLREAITMANDEGSHPGHDTIQIGLVGSIQLHTELPAITTDMSIIGPGADRVTVERNPPPPGAAFRVFNVNESLSGVPDVTIAGLTISGGLDSAGGGSDPVARGGGIRNSGNLILREVALRDNRVEATGASESADAGGAAIFSIGSLTIVRSLIAFNVAQASQSGFLGCSCATVSGAGVLARTSSPGQRLLIRDSTLVQNTGEATATLLAASVAGLYAEDGGSIEGSTIAQNFSEGANFSRAAIYTDARLDLRNTLIAYNALTAGDPNCVTDSGQESFLNSLGHNLASDASCGLDQATDRPPTPQPLLQSIADNGGPTETMAMLPNSPARDAGIGTGTDQRGEPRPSDDIFLANALGGNGADIGAFELQVDNPNCRGREGTLAARPGKVTRGTRRADVVIGTTSRDRVLGRGGKDRICGAAKRDRLVGGAGQDSLVGGPGRDVLIGGPGPDRLLGGGGRDVLRGGAGRDRQRQ